MSEERARWRRVTELFEAALDRPAPERRAFLEAASGGDTTLLAEVTSLLDSHLRAAQAAFIERPAVVDDSGFAAEAAEAMDAADSLAGRTIGPYRIEREIARGGMGVVYLAHDTRLGRVVALKALPARLTADAERRERLRREARAAAALAHPSVAVVYALEEIDGTLFIASEYIEGHSLREEIRRGSLDPHTAVATAAAIASALAAAHASGIVHRDLKPENVMRARDGQIKVLDFGLARTITPDPEAPTSVRLTIEGAVVGTPGYMPPEQLEGRPVDARADVYAFGVLLHELVTGRLPASGAPISSGGTSIPAGVGSIISKSLALNPDARYQDGAELVSALAAIALPAGNVRSTPSLAAARPPSWWWQFHQMATAAFHALLLMALWSARSWLDAPWRTILVFGGLAAATADVTMRLNLVFASRVHPVTLGAQLSRLSGPIAAANVTFVLVLCIAAAAAAGQHDELAAALVGGAIISLVSLLVIEPATSRAAFGRASEQPRDHS
jgi:predicted Ser/Thr protein kinase